jgi:hypothetical protein
MAAMPSAASAMPSAASLSPMMGVPMSQTMSTPASMSFPPGAVPVNAGFGPQMFDEPEVRSAPIDNRPENMPVPDDRKNSGPARHKMSDGSDVLPSGTDKQALYGALDDIKRAEMVDQAQKLMRRRRINVIPMLLALFVPWFVFLTSYWVMSYFLHYSNPTVAVLVCFSLMLIVFYYGRKSFKTWNESQNQRDFYPAYLSVACGIMLALGIVLGDRNFWSRMVPCYNVEFLAKYNQVNPSTHTQRSGGVVPTRGKRYQDAGMIYFDHDTILDTSRAMSFKMGELFCVAPIVDKKCKKNCGYDFWAVGINCCSEDTADFRCGEYNKPGAKAGLRLMLDEQRPHFRMAVLEAEGVHNIVSTHPLFFYWLHDPVGELAHMKKLGYKEFVILMIFTFFLNGLMAFFALKWAREAFWEKR